MLRLQDIRRLHIELTTKCNARCPMCMRNYRGYDFNSGYPLCELLFDDFVKIVSPTLCAQIISPDPVINGRVPVVRDFRGVIFNGNLGDFASARHGLQIVKYLVENKVPVSICTNGSLRNPKWWKQLALPGVSVGFALDGLEDTHSLYRQDTDWHKIIANATAFIKAGGHAVWRFVPFDHNRHQESQCKELSKQLGFASFENIFDGRSSTPVYTRTGSYSHSIGNSPTPPPNVHPLLENHISWYNAATVKHEKDTPTLNILCIHKRNKEIYIAADGSVYPCCFLGFYPGQMHHPGNAELQHLVMENNALQFSLEHCLNWFDKVEQTWQQPSISQGRTYQCVVTCNRSST